MIAALLLAAAGPSCAAARPAACRDTNQLAHAPDVMPMLRRFFGRTPSVPLLHRGASLATQMAEVLGGPPDHPARIGRLYRFTACRAHSCTEKGALVLTPGGAPVAAAVLHSPCAETPAPPRCSEINLLTIYVRRVQHAVVADIRHWAAQAVAAQSIDTAPPLVRIIRLDSRLPARTGRRPSFRASSPYR